MKYKNVRVDKTTQQVEKLHLLQIPGIATNILVRYLLSIHLVNRINN